MDLITFAKSLRYRVTHPEHQFLLRRWRNRQRLYNSILEPTACPAGPGKSPSSVVLQKVVLACTPRLKDYPQQLARIQRFASQKSTPFRLRGYRRRLQQNLISGLRFRPPHLSAEEIEDLMICLDGFQMAKAYYDLSDGPQLDAALQDHKRNFLRTLTGELARKTKDDYQPGENFNASIQHKKQRKS